MNIIFGDAINDLPSNYVTLELDTINIQPINNKFITWCVVDSADLVGQTNVDRDKKMHSDLWIEYRNQNWKACKELIKELMGCWNGEADSFYQEILKRIDVFTLNPPEPGWDGSIVKHAGSA